MLVSAGCAILMGIAIDVDGVSDLPNKIYVWILFAIGAIGAIASVIVIYRQPESQVPCTFKVPYLPIVASLCSCINLILVLKLSATTWTRFAVWMTLGEYYFNCGPVL